MAAETSTVPEVRPDVMASPGATEQLDLESHRCAEENFRTQPTHGRPEKPTHSSESLFERFVAARSNFWREQRSSIRNGCYARLAASSERAKYECSSDGNWVMESIWYPADMCALNNRFVFNLWTGLQLKETDMYPWLTLDPPRAAPCRMEVRSKSSAAQAWPTDLKQLTVDENGPDPQIYSSRRANFPNLQYNIGCHDDSDEEEPRPDYETGCRSVTFHECALSQPRGLHTAIQTMRASRYCNTFDNTGRHWLYTLPTSPLEPVVRDVLSRIIPQPEVVQNIWAYANSWPLADLPEYHKPVKSDD
eukprot:TRINITY_DN16563_c0_g1_i1.p1 TRINITY_DN16563_c0_g1~~TRINITY_DN16563_c0_g1_i1.p1  ORF type:complete len:306 (+),score=48.28 TRINITY_DN16563_c0_g1_i1:106-1023(+)